MHMGHKVAVTEALQVAEEGRDAAVDDHLIEHHLLVQVSIVVCMSLTYITNGTCCTSQ